MRALTLSAILLSAHPSLAHFSLSQLQPIAGFSDACTQAYNTPFTACSISDFYEEATCSAQCIAFLEGMTKLLNDDCKGITAFPNTLIGMFFQKTAVKKLCPNVEITTVSAAGAGQGSRPSQAEPTAGPKETAAASTPDSLTPATPSHISVEVTSTTSETAITTAAVSTLSTTAASLAPSTTTSISLASGPISPGSRAGGGPAPSSPQVGEASGSSAAQANPTAGSQRNNGGGGNNNGNGGTVLDAASNADRGARATKWLLPASAGLAAAIWSSTFEMSEGVRSDRQKMATTTDTAEIAKMETELNAQRNQAFFSMVRIGHVNPGVARALASVYRAALTCNTYICQQAENQEIDTMWLYFLYSACAFTALGVAEMGMSFGAKLIGMMKYLMFIPMLGIPTWAILTRRSAGEIAQFFSTESEGDEEVQVARKRRRSKRTVSTEK
ncbi:MAG: hypothetical protein Q9225_006064 [Loekoesia sp. 1 TL-2023]